MKDNIQEFVTKKMVLSCEKLTITDTNNDQGNRKTKIFS